MNDKTLKEIEKVSDMVRGEPADGNMERYEVVETLKELCEIAYEDGWRNGYDSPTSNGTIESMDAFKMGQKQERESLSNKICTKCQEEIVKYVR